MTAGNSLSYLAAIEVVAILAQPLFEGLPALAKLRRSSSSSLGLRGNIMLARLWPRRAISTNVIVPEIHRVQIFLVVLGKALDPRTRQIGLVALLVCAERKNVVRGHKETVALEPSAGVHNCVDH